MLGYLRIVQRNVEASQSNAPALSVYEAQMTTVPDGTMQTLCSERIATDDDVANYVVLASVLEEATARLQRFGWRRAPEHDNVARGLAFAFTMS